MNQQRQRRYRTAREAAIARREREGAPSKDAHGTGNLNTSSPTTDNCTDGAATTVGLSDVTIFGDCADVKVSSCQDVKGGQTKCGESIDKGSNNCNSNYNPTATPIRGATTNSTNSTNSSGMFGGKGVYGSKVYILQKALAQRRECYNLGLNSRSLNALRIKALLRLARVNPQAQRVLVTGGFRGILCSLRVLRRCVASGKSKNSGLCQRIGCVKYRYSGVIRRYIILIFKKFLILDAIIS